jgi:glycosyltransferase involved in cell wall biosynthesis
MAQGLPVVTSNFGGAREIVPPEAGRLVSPGEVAELARTLGELLSNPMLRTQLQRVGPNHARQLADPESRLAEVELLAAKPAVAPRR